MRYKHVNTFERNYIDIHLKTGTKIYKIASNLHRSVSTITQEIQRNSVNNIYEADQANMLANKRQKMHINFSKYSDLSLVKFVQEKLILGWSPEQIQGRLKRFSSKLKISFKTIYSWIYRGLLAKINKLVLRKKGKIRKSQEKRGKFIGKQISDRPFEVQLRQKVGHWEADTIVSSRGKSKYCLLTLVERVSKFTLAILCKDRTSIEINNSIIKHLSFLSHKLVKTITCDRGKEFSGWKFIEKSLKIDVYFADPYSPWQRGTNENTNGLIREKFPKKFDFSKTSKIDVATFVQNLNERPRKKLNYLTPIEYLCNMI